jgi:hypothetical protein
MDLFPANNPSRFFIKLPEVVEFNGSQMLNVFDLNIPEFIDDDVKSIYVTVNIAAEVIVGFQKVPVVQRYFVQTELQDVGFLLDTQIIETNVKEISTDIIEIGIVDGNSLEYVQFKEGVTYCGLKID